MSKTTYGDKTIRTELINICKAKNYKSILVSETTGSTIITLYHDRNKKLISYTSSVTSSNITLLIISEYTCPLIMIQRNICSYRIVLLKNPQTSGFFDQKPQKNSQTFLN